MDYKNLQSIVDAAIGGSRVNQVYMKTDKNGQCCDKVLDKLHIKAGKVKRAKDGGMIGKDFNAILNKNGWTSSDNPHKPTVENVKNIQPNSIIAMKGKDGVNHTVFIDAKKRAHTTQELGGNFIDRNGNFTKVAVWTKSGLKNKKK